MVLALRNPPALGDAVRSLLAQDEPVEVVVVNSGGGDAAASLASQGLSVRVVEHARKLLPGAARNAGIEALPTPFIAFLAADCIAEDGWARVRMEHHRRGALAVASAVTNADRRSVSAWTSYIALFSSRMPGVPAEHAQRYGASYARTLFERHGLFREDLRGGEDTDFHARIGCEVVWDARVRTAHRHPRNAIALVRDQYRRGARSARSWQTLGGPPALDVARNAIARAPRQVATAWRATRGIDRAFVAFASLLMPLAVAAYAAGAIRHRIAPQLEEES